MSVQLAVLGSGESLPSALCWRSAREGIAQGQDGMMKNGDAYGTGRVHKWIAFATWAFRLTGRSVLGHVTARGMWPDWLQEIQLAAMRAEREDYHAIPDIDCWPESRDAFRYPGPGPVICHPPCGPWGNYRSKSHESIDHGIKAMELVHRWGGVVEQPRGSQLFKVWGRQGAVERVEQSTFGHKAIKKTLLYWCLGESNAP